MFVIYFKNVLFMFRDEKQTTKNLTQVFTCFFVVLRRKQRKL